MRAAVFLSLAAAVHGGKISPIAIPSTSTTAPQGPRTPLSGGLSSKLGEPARDSIRLAVLLSYARALVVGYEPAEMWLRRFVGGIRKRNTIWGEYCSARDAVIASSAADSTPVVLKAVILARLVEDLRSEFRFRYPAWASLFDT
jgi:hypothetical protein